MAKTGCRNNGNDLLPWFFFFVGVATRVPFASRFLLHMDSCQFALALDKFDVTVHQPHPPGYFLYVMAGKVLHFVIADVNRVFVTISVFFGGLAVAFLYLLGKEIFDRKTGIVAALLALSSPTMWFHGEVALTYILEACFSTIFALYSWRILKGEEKYLWVSVVVLGVAGGIRQNTPLFLLPLWLYSVRHVSPRKIVASLGVLAVACLLWLVPMVKMTGGWDAYQGALRELWLFNTGGHSLFEGDWVAFIHFFFKMNQFIVFGLGAGLYPFCTAVYILARRKQLKSLDSRKVAFFGLWVLPIAAFYLFVFLAVQNPGYVLIFLPAFFILASFSFAVIADEFREGFRKVGYRSLITVVVALNTSAFLFLNFPVSYPWIRTHDRNLSAMVHELETFDPAETAVFVNNYIYYSYRHVMIYVPEYQVYNVDVRVASTGEVRKTFHGYQKTTYLSMGFPLSPQIRYFFAPLSYDDDKYKERNRYVMKGLIVKDLTPTLSIVSGPISMIQIVFPEVRVSKPFHGRKTPSVSKNTRLEQG